MTKLGFIGFGLIGASIAKALKAKKPGKYMLLAMLVFVLVIFVLTASVG